MRKVLRGLVGVGLTADQHGVLYSLTLGTVRRLNTIDFIIARTLRRSRLDTLAAERRAALRLAIYECRWGGSRLSRAVEAYFPDDTEMARVVRRAQGLDLDSATAHLLLANQLSIKCSHPTFLVETLLGHLPEEEVRELLKKNNDRRKHYLRVNQFRARNNDDIIGHLRELGAKIVPDPDIDGLFQVVENAQKVIDSQYFVDGDVMVQDKASVVTVKALDPQPGEVVWDACAAPGQKTELIWELMRGEGRLVASDVHRQRARDAKERLDRFGCPGVQWVHGDASTALVRGADRVLIDAPCTSVGMVQSHPSFKWRLNRRALLNLTTVQNKILTGIVKAYSGCPDTVFVYSTCSLLPQEGEWQVDSLLRTFDIELLDPGCTGDPGYAGFECSQYVRRLFPHRHETHGFFIAKFRVGS